MWKEAVHAVVGPVAHAFVRRMVRHDAELATPVGTPISHGSGPDPDRVLILGSPVVQGIGVTSYDLAFAGHLARQLAARTGRGADVEARGIDRFDALTAADAMRTENLDRFDLVLILGGVTEIVSLLPLSRYERNLRVLFDAIAASVPATLPVLIAGVAPFMEDMGASRSAVAWMDRRIARQNAATLAECARSGVATYVDFVPARTGIRLGRDSSAVYESWARALIPVIERALAASQPREPVPANETTRMRALDALGVDDAPNATVDHIVEMARDMLGVEAASLNFIDGDRQWSKAATGIAADDIPRTQAICNTTIQTPGVFVVEDLDADPAFEHAAWRSGADHPRFYAGYPLEAPGGERVGALCVMGRMPRHFSSAETATLRDLALRAQAVLWENRAAV